MTDLFHSLVPAPSAPRIDWRAIEAAFEWLRALEACPQDPIHHREGNVLIHTRMVVEALVADRDWRTLEPAPRAALFWAALLHDVAKPATTRTDMNGRITSPGHARRGQIMARTILWRLAVPFAQRELICHAVTHHQLPLYLIERDRPERRIHAISLQTRCDLLAVLARADVNGRICSDAARLHDNIALFVELAREQACLTGPRTFPSDHSRFLYFRRPDRAVDYHAHDNWPSEVTLLSGLPAAGKDSWLAAQADGRPVVSLDALRDELGIDAREPQGPVIVAARERARALLRAHTPFVWNATNLSRELRSGLIDLCADYKAKVSIVYLEAGEPELMLRNRERARPVPKSALARMLERWEPPDLTECHTLDIVTAR